jgi:hypothetical protein
MGSVTVLRLEPSICDSARQAPMDISALPA